MSDDAVAPPPPTSPRERLFTFGFVALNVFVLFAFCNLAVFYGIRSYLADQAMPEALHGVLIGLFSASALVCRPWISLRLSPRNALRGTALGMACILAALPLYAHVQGAWPLALLRILHGLGYVTLMSSSVTLLMLFLPRSRSGQGFGIVTIMTLLPYALAPFVVERWCGGLPEATLYALTAITMVPPLLLLHPLSRSVRARLALLERDTPAASAASGDKADKGTPGQGLRTALRTPHVCRLLAANGLLFAVHALVFFYCRDFLAASGAGDVGTFFMVSTGCMIALRLFLGTLFDKMDKALLAMVGLAIMAAGCWQLGAAHTPGGGVAAAVLYGVGMGAASPLLNSLMFSLSPPAQQGLNTNLMIEMVDAGFFIGPALGGLAATAFIPAVLLAGGAALLLLASLLLFPAVHAQPSTG